MRSDLSSLLAGRPLIAVVGATDHPHKYGGRIYRNLKQKGYPVLPVNHHRATVDGDPAYADLAALPGRPALIDLVVPASEGLTVVGQALELGLDNIWVQPGAESAELEAFLARSGMAYSLYDCIMVQS